MNKWTDDEINYLRKYYPDYGAIYLIKNNLINRSNTAIMAKAGTLNIKNITRYCPNKKTTKEYERDLIEQRPDVSLVDNYIGSNIKVSHICNVCDHIWEVSPNHILSMKTQCPECSLKNRLNSDEYVNNVLEVNNLKALTKYTGTFKDITVKSEICNHTWTTKFSYIQQGSGCPLCNKGFGYDKNKENMPKVAQIYLLKIDLITNKSFLKIGVTTGNIQVRIRNIKCSIGKENVKNIFILKEITNSGIKVLEKEKELLNKYNNYKSNLKFAGCTELLFTIDKNNILKDMEI